MAATLVRRRHRRSRYRWPSPTRFERLATRAVCGLSGIAAAATGLHPTANRFSDVVFAFALGAAAAAASGARTWAWLVLAGIAGAVTAGWAAVPAVAALAVALAFALSRGRPLRRLAGAVIGGLALQSLLRIDGGRFGWSAAVTAVAIGLTLVSGWWNARGGSRRIVAGIGLAVAGISCGLAASFGLTVLQARSNIELGTRLANEGLTAARAGDTAQAASLLDQADHSFAGAHGNLGSWLAKPAAVLPVLGQQARALDLLSRAGADVAASATVAARRADVQRLTVHHGRLDLARAAAMREPIASVAHALAGARTASDGAASHWLLPPVASRLGRFALAIRHAQIDAETAAQGIAVVPDLFGGHEPRHYFVAFTNPSETRALGGFTGAYAEMVIDDGRIELVRHGGVEELNAVGRGHRHFADPTVFPHRFRELLPEQFWQNVSGTPDFPTMAEAIRQLWPQSGGGHLDGVMVVDPYALAGLLQLTGPVPLKGLDVPLTSRNAARFLLRDQYLRFGVIDQRLDFLTEATRTVFDKLTSADLPGPRTVGEVMGPLVRGKHLLLDSFHPREQALFERLGTDGAVPPPNGRDFLSVRSSNRAANKIDSLLGRTLDYSVAVDPASGRVRAKLSVTLRNDAPATGLPPYIVRNDLGRTFGTNIMTLEVSSPLGLVGVTSGGRPAGVAVGAEYGRPVYTTLVEVPPKSTRVVTFTLHGRLEVSAGYHLTVVPQPMVNADRAHLDVTATRGWRVAGSRFDAVLTEDAELTATFHRA